MKKVKVKYRVVMLLVFLVIVVIGSTATYSLFHSTSNLTANQELAQFVFDAKNTDHIDLNFVNLTPGSSEDYFFSVTNKENNKISHVTIQYQITIKTFHTMPLNIILYDVKEGEKKLLQCDESFSRDENHNLICNSPVQEMSYQSEELDRYKVRVEFPEEYNGVEYSDLVDYISIDIKSWQKTS